MLLGLNWIDGIIVALLVATVLGSLRVGFFTQLFVIGGFFGALFAGGWIFPHLLPFEDKTIRTIINANLVMLSATFVALKGYELGRKLHWSITQGKFRRLEAAFGIIPSLAATLTVIWLMAAMISRLPFAGFSNSANDALIVQSLNRILPSVPAVFALFNSQVDPNRPPNLFAQPQPQKSFAFSQAAVESGAAQANNSIVRVTGFGCGGVQGGSGFVAAKDLVATNAHVVAGVKRPIIKYDGHSFEGLPVLFNPGLDLAILRVIRPIHSFTAPQLELANDIQDSNATVAIAGFPRGEYKVSPGIIRNDAVVRGRNIYDLGVITRHIYEVQTTVDYGDSGAPLVLPDGSVAGMVFAKYLADGTHYAFALTSQEIKKEVTQVVGSHKRVGTGACLVAYPSS